MLDVHSRPRYLVMHLQDVTERRRAELALFRAVAAGVEALGPSTTRATMSQIAFARRRGYDLSPLRARLLEVEDFERFHYILGMDEHNLRVLQRMRRALSQRTMDLGFRAERGPFDHMPGVPSHARQISHGTRDDQWRLQGGPA